MLSQRLVLISPVSHRYQHAVSNCTDNNGGYLTDCQLNEKAMAAHVQIPVSLVMDL